MSVVAFAESGTDDRQFQSHKASKFWGCNGTKFKHLKNPLPCCWPPSFKLPLPSYSHLAFDSQSFLASVTGNYLPSS